MGQFLGVAAAHFLALLIPGVDFFLIVRTSVGNGWRSATGTCVGIAAVNGLFIGVAFSGISFVSNERALTVLQIAGGAFLVFVGSAFLRDKANVNPAALSGFSQAKWWRNFSLGAGSALLNPKNLLFYASLAAVLSTKPSSQLVLYGVWMVSAVLVWDVLVAVVFGSERSLRLAGRALPVITKLAGGFLVVFGTVMVVVALT